MSKSKRKRLKGKRRPAKRQNQPAQMQGGIQKPPYKFFTVTKAVWTLIGGIMTGAGWWSGVFAEPDIHVIPGNISNPFTAHFSVHNPGRFFVMKNVQFRCLLGHIHATRNINFSGGAAEQRGLYTEIAPEKTVQYQCPFNGFYFADGIESTSIKLAITYDRILRGRTAESDLLNWDSVRRQWSEGKIIN